MKTLTALAILAFALPAVAAPSPQRTRLQSETSAPELNLMAVWRKDGKPLTWADRMRFSRWIEVCRKVVAEQHGRAIEHPHSYVLVRQCVIEFSEELDSELVVADPGFF